MLTSVSQRATPSVTVSYSCMNNVKKTISEHNKKPLKQYQSNSAEEKTNKKTHARYNRSQNLISAILKTKKDKF